jgi:hypothetical protein
MTGGYMEQEKEERLMPDWTEMHRLLFRGLFQDDAE